MRRSTEPASGLRLVLLVDRRNQTCCVCSHNLDSEDASQEVAELRRDGLPAFTVDQSSRHTQFDPDECVACQGEIKRSVTLLPAFQRRKPT